jgi:hypothetical protein
MNMDVIQLILQLTTYPLMRMTHGIMLTLILHQETHIQDIHSSITFLH